MGWGAVRPLNDGRDIRSAAAALIAREYAVCAIDPHEKKPTYAEWSIRPLTPDDFRPGEGIGIMAGPVSGTTGHALVFVDLDGMEAVRMADEYLPRTGMMEGRPSKPSSHRGFMIPLDSIPPDKHSAAEMAASAAVERYGHPGPKIEHYAKVLDLIGTGGQVVVPPTVHESGEVRAWAGGRPGEPAVVPYPDLLRAVNALLAACGYTPRKKVVPPFVKAPANPILRPPLGLDPPTAVVRVDGELRRRIEAYLDAVPPAVSGEGGHRRTYAVACALTWGFGLNPETAIEFLARRYNPRCVPPWSLPELERKVASAAAASDHRHPRGHLLRGHARPRPAAITTPWIPVR